MGLITSRLNLDGLHTNRRRSHQGEEQLYSYSLNKNYFSNYFFMGGERFEMNDPDYLFGDSCDLNFLTCTKPYSLPYKKAQQNLLTNLNTKQKAINKVSSRVGGLNTPLNILTGRHRQVSQARKQDAQTQTLNQSRKTSAGAEPTQPLVMLINIRKETLRLVKSNSAYNLDSDQNSLTNTASESAAICDDSTTPRLSAAIGTQQRHQPQATTSNKNHQLHHQHPNRDKIRGNPSTTNRYSTASSHSTTIHPQDSTSSSAANIDCVDGEEHIELGHTMYGSSRRSYQDSDDISSITSHTLSTSQSTHTTGSSTTGKSGYTSVRDVPPSDSASDENDEYFEDALNEPANDEDNDSERTNQQKALLVARGSEESTRRNCAIKITIDSEDEDEDDDNDEDDDDETGNHDPTISDTGRDMPDGGKLSKTNFTSASKSTTTAAAHSKILTKVSRNRGSRRNKKTTISGDKRGNKTVESNKHHHHHHHHQTGASTSSSSNRVYNIEFYFDTEVDCSIRVSYFCTREVSSNNVTYKPKHATYKSKTYTYKRGLNQKFEQPEHTFQPYLFDEDLLIYKPLDTDGNYNSGAVFPIVIHCVALEGPAPRQSQSLVATVEKSQLDDSYSIKPLKQLIFVDGVQYILQDIYGIENKPLASIKSSSRAPTTTKPMSRNLRSSCNSLYSISGTNNNNNNMTTNTNGSNMNLSDTASIASALAMDTSLGDARNRGSLISNNQFRSLGSENTFECVICMSEERDTMLLPCRHMCLCSSCAQSLRYQSSSCPICRCPFKAALNVRFIRRSSSGGGGGGGSRPVRSSQTVPDQIDEHDTATTTTARTHAKSANNNSSNETTANDNSARRESLTNSATPLLARQKSVGTEADSGLESSTTPAVMATSTKGQHSRLHDDDDDEQQHEVAASGASVEVHKTNAASSADANFELRSMKWNVKDGGGRVAQEDQATGGNSGVVAVESNHQRESLDK